MKTAFDKIAQGLEEAIDVAHGRKQPHRLNHADIDVAAIRQKTNLTQEGFAHAFGFSLSQVRDWEQGRSAPQGGIRAYLLIIGDEPETVLNLLRKNNVMHAA